MGHYRNPILRGCHPDPSVCRVGDAFYLATSSFVYLPGLPIHRSTNLVDWDLIGHAIHRPDQLDLGGLPSSRGLYAPTIRHHRGRFHVTCTVVGPDTGGWGGRTGHFVVTADDPADGWSDPVWLDALGGIDPSLTFDRDRLWLCATRLADPGLWPGQTDVWIVELDPWTYQAASEPVRIWSGAMNGAVWAEGPHVMARPGGGWMLVAAEGGTARDHAVCVAYADDITGPYRGDPANPRLTHRDLGDRTPIADVGHADLVEDGHGGWWATMLAVRTSGGQNGLLGRQTHLVPVEWEAARPLFAPGVGRVLEDVVHEGVPDQRAGETVLVDDFDSPILDPEWAAAGRLPSAFVDLSVRPGHARVHASTVEPYGVGELSFLCRRLPWASTHVSAVVAQVSGSVRGGVLLRTSERSYLELSVVSDGRARAVLVVDGAETEVAAADRVRTPVVLEVEVDGFVATLRLDGRSLAVVDVSSLAPDGSSTFMGPWVGVTAVGEGFVDVDRVELTRLDLESTKPLDDAADRG